MHRAVQFVNTLSAVDGGPARHALEVNFALNGTGHATQLISIKESADSLLKTYLGRNDAPTITPKDGFRHLKLSDLRGLLGANEWIIHGYYLGWVPFVTILGVTLRKRVFLMPHGALTAYDRRRKSAKKRMFHYVAGWWINRSVNFVVATAQEAGELSEVDGFRKVSVVGAGSALTGMEIRPHEIGTKVQLLSMSRIAPKKRVDRAVRVVANLIGRGVPAELTIAGTGESKVIDSVISVVEECGVAEHVHFIGQVEGDEKLKVYNRSDIFLLLSEDENFGIGLADALSMGIPAVVTPAVSAAMGLPEDVVAVVSDDSPVSAADQVLKLITNYLSRRELARVAAEQNFSWRAVAENWQRTLDGDQGSRVLTR